jgi:hypothetical protein
MKVNNVFDSFTAPTFTFFPYQEPAPDMPDYEEQKKKFELEKEAFLTLTETESLQDSLTVRFSLGSVLFDLITAAIKAQVFVLPQSPKLVKRFDKQLADFAQIADNEGEIEIPDDWITYIDKLLNDDNLFSQVGIHGEIGTVSKGDNRKSLAMKGRIITLMSKINEALLQMLPE